MTHLYHEEKSEDQSQENKLDYTEEFLYNRDDK